MKQQAQHSVFSIQHSVFDGQRHGLEGVLGEHRVLVDSVEHLNVRQPEKKWCTDINFIANAGLSNLLIQLSIIIPKLPEHLSGMILRKLNALVHHLIYLYPQCPVLSTGTPSKEMVTAKTFPAFLVSALPLSVFNPLTANSSPVLMLRNISCHNSMLKGLDGLLLNSPMQAVQSEIWMWRNSVTVIYAIQIILGNSG